MAPATGFGKRQLAVLGRHEALQLRKAAPPSCRLAARRSGVIWCAFFSHGLDVSRAESAVDLTCSGARHARIAKSRWLWPARPRKMTFLEGANPRSNAAAPLQFIILEQCHPPCCHDPECNCQSVTCSAWAITDVKTLRCLCVKTGVRMERKRALSRRAGANTIAIARGLSVVYCGYGRITL